MDNISREMFQQKFGDKLQKISSKQVVFDNQNMYNPALRNEYKQFLEFCFMNKASLMGNENLLNTIQALLKYNQKYITDVDVWKAQFN